jgi:spoIIIJ-associated protein
MTNVLNDPDQAAKKIASFLKTLSTTGGMKLKSEIRTGSGEPQPDSAHQPKITVELSGPDTPLLLARNGELLHAIEHIAAKILRLEP